MCNNATFSRLQNKHVSDNKLVHQNKLFLCGVKRGWAGGPRPKVKVTNLFWTSDARGRVRRLSSCAIFTLHGALAQKRIDQSEVRETNQPQSNKESRGHPCCSIWLGGGGCGDLTTMTPTVCLILAATLSAARPKNFAHHAGLVLSTNEVLLQHINRSEALIILHHQKRKIFQPDSLVKISGNDTEMRVALGGLGKKSIQNFGN